MYILEGIMDFAVLINKKLKTKAENFKTLQNRKQIMEIQYKCGNKLGKNKLTIVRKYLIKIKKK